MATTPAKQLIVQNIESFVDASRSSSQHQQAANVNAIANLLKNDVVTIEQLVREMDMYLTTTDHILRARGILLLAEVLASLASKQLQSTSIHSLICFFTERLTDWRALRGALVGCLALLRRKSSAGVISTDDARALAEFYLQNLHVRSLGKRDRKLCFELLETLLDRYPEALTELGDLLVSGICGVIDEEQDPQCLMHSFHIVEVVGRLFPDSSGPVANYAQDLFDIIGRYFPIHYIHTNNEDVQLSRDDLSKALMLAFSSSPFFEPSAIPLLLEKLSSSLPLAKVDSLKYLTYCTTEYGPERMGKHAEAIWGSIKTAIYSSLDATVLFSPLDPTENLGFHENEIMREAFILLQKVTSQQTIFLNVVLRDEDISNTINIVSSSGSFDDLPHQTKQKMLAVGRILCILAKTSLMSCNRVFEAIFVRLIDTLGVSSYSSSVDSFVMEADTSMKCLNFGALYLCIHILGACRELAVESVELSPDHNFSDDAWHQSLSKVSISLANTFTSNLFRSISDKYADQYISLLVKALQIMATFPGDSLLLSKSLYELILTTLVTIMIKNSHLISLWKCSLKALVQIGSFIDEYYESKKSISYMDIVVERTVSLLSRGDSTMPFSLLLEAISDISTAGNTFMLRIVQGIEENIRTMFYEVYVDGDLRNAGMLAQLLDCYSHKLLPRVQKGGDSESVSFHFASAMWDLIGKARTDVCIESKEVLSAAMMGLKLSIASCSEIDQCSIVEKAYAVIGSSEPFLQMQSMPVLLPCKSEGLLFAENLSRFASKDEWIFSLFASVIVAARPGTYIPNIKAVVQLFMIAILKGHIPSAQALGSMVNKMQQKGSEDKNADSFYLEDALEIIFKMIPWRWNDDILLGAYGMDDASMQGLNVGKVAYLHLHSVIGLSWIGKGLLMRGHEKIKEITMIFLRCFFPSSELEKLTQKEGLLEGQYGEDILASLMKSAADAFHVIISDSEDCLNKRFHATVRPLYKQRLFSTLTPILLPLMLKSCSSANRPMLFRAFGHVMSDIPLAVVLSDTKKLLPALLNALSVLSEDIVNNDMIYSLLLVLSGILMDRNGQNAVMENAHIIIKSLIRLVSYPYKMLVRETAVQCLVAISRLPHARIYPMRSQVLHAVSKALDDQKRAVRQEAVRCRQAWYVFNVFICNVTFSSTFTGHQLHDCLVFSSFEQIITLE